MPASGKQFTELLPRTAPPQAALYECSCKTTAEIPKDTIPRLEKASRKIEYAVRIGEFDFG